VNRWPPRDSTESAHASGSWPLHVPADRRLRLGESRAATVGTGLAPADRLRVWAAGYLAPWGVGSRQPSDVDYPLASPGQARRVFTERSGPPGTKRGGRSA
jgi:hypothetical protein